MDRRTEALIIEACNLELRKLQVFFTINKLNEYLDAAIKSQTINNKRYSKNEVKTICERWVRAGYLIDINISLQELIKKNGVLIRYVPEEMQTDELRKLAIEHDGAREIPVLTAEEIVLASHNRYFEYICREEITKKLTEEQLIEVLKNSPQIMCEFHTMDPGMITKKVLYAWLEHMVKGNIPYLLDYKSNIPKELLDITTYRAFCMVNGYNFKIIPDDLKEIVITDKLINYCLDNAKSYVGNLWLMESIPEKYKTHDVCFKACVNHFAAIKYIPRCFMNNDFYMELIKAGQTGFISYVDQRTISKEVFMEAYNNDKSYHLDKINEKLWSIDLAEKIVKREYEALKCIPQKYRTEDIYQLYAKYHGLSDDIPKNKITMEMCINAMQRNASYTIGKVPKELKTPEFYKECIDKSCIYINDIPKEYLSNEVVMNLIKNNKVKSFKDIPLEYRTSAVAEVYVDTQGYNDLKIMGTYVTEKMVEKMASINNKYGLCFLLSKLPEEVVPSHILDEIVDCNDALNISYLGRTRIEKHLEKYPMHILKLPEDYDNQVIEKKEEKQVHTTITYDNFKQMTIWDVLAG